MLSSLPDRKRALGELRSPGELLLLARISAIAAVVPLLMRLPLPRVALLLERATRRIASGRAADVQRLDQLIALAPRVGRPVVRQGCLTRGVTLFWFLRRAGVDVELCFGIEAANGHAPEGHCWLALDGQPYLERVDPRPRFAEIYRVPGTVAS